MNIQDILSSQGPALLGKLQEAGLSGEQAREFLPEVGEQLSGGGIGGLLGGGGIESLLGGGGIEGLLEKVDLAALASKVGIDPELARSALAAIGPQLMEGLKGDAGGLPGGLGSKLLG